MWYCYAPSPYLRTDRESKSTTVLQTQEGSLFIPSALGPKSHPTQGNPTRAPNKGVWRLIYRQFFVSVTGIAGITWLARQDERISYLFLVNMTEVLETVVWSLTITDAVLIGKLITVEIGILHITLYVSVKSPDFTWMKEAMALFGGERGTCKYYFILFKRLFFFPVFFFQCVLIQVNHVSDGVETKMKARTSCLKRQRFIFIEI